MSLSHAWVRVALFSGYLKGEVWDDWSFSLVPLLYLVHWSLNGKLIILESSSSIRSCRGEFSVNLARLEPSQGDLVTWKALKTTLSTQEGVNT